MYEAFFGLDDKPFDMTPDPRYLYLSESHEEALAALLYGIRETKGLISLSGPVGVGKTTILFSFFEQIKNDSKIVFFQGGISRDRMTFLRELCVQYGISPDQESLPGLTQAIKDFNLNKMRQGKSVVLLVDEAQDLAIEEFNHFHYLNNLEVPKAKLLQIILCGSDDMDERLRNEKLRSLRQRVAIRCKINPLNPKESVEYIFHRLHVAGHSKGNLFTTEAMWQIVNYSCGIPRVINVVCDNTMIIAFALKNIPIEEVNVLEALENIEGDEISYKKEENVSKEEINRICQEVSQRISQGGYQRSGSPLDYENGSLQANGHSLNAERCSRLGEIPDPFEIESDQEEAISSEIFRPFFYLGPKGILSALVVISCLTVFVILYFISQGTDSSVEEGPPAHLRSIAEEGERGKENLQQYNSQGHGIIERNKITAQGKDIAKIALEYYGGLNIHLLSLLQESNPHIQDWNRLESSSEIILPQGVAPIERNINFYSIQIICKRSKKIIYKIVNELTGKGYQNIFIIKDRPNSSGQRWIRICVGVFENKQASLVLVKSMQELGFHDAFSLKLINKPLESILYPVAMQ